MRKRGLWFVVGVGLTILVVLKGREWYERFTPKGVAKQLHQARESLTDRASDFVATVKSSAAQREAEIREALSGE